MGVTDRVRRLLRNPNAALVNLSDLDFLSLLDCYTHILATGGTGSGKSSSLAQLALALMLLGCGFVWCCAKPDEVHLVRRIARAARREQDVEVFGEDIDGRLTPLRFNALNYESKRAGGTLSLVAYLGDIGRSAMRGSQNSGGEDNSFWRTQMDLFTGYCVDTVLLAGLPLTMQLLRDIQKSAPTHPAQLQSETWHQGSVLIAALKRAEKRVDAGQAVEADLTRVLDYWFKDYFNLDQKPRSIIDVMFAALADQYAREPNLTLLSTDTNITPEHAMNGKIIVLSLPTRKYFEPGRLAQLHFKYSLQRSMLERSVDSHSLPVCLWCDEAHNFVCDFDFEYLAEVRSRLGINVYLEQSLGGFMKPLGIHNSKVLDGFLTNFQCKFFFQNTSEETNRYAAELFGRNITEREAYNYGVGGDGQVSGGGSMHEHMELQVQPREFSELWTGGMQFDRHVQAFVYKRGTKFLATGTNFLKTTFHQTELTS